MTRAAYPVYGVWARHAAFFSSAQSDAGVAIGSGAEYTAFLGSVRGFFGRVTRAAYPVYGVFGIGTRLFGGLAR